MQDQIYNSIFINSKGQCVITIRSEDDVFYTLRKFFSSFNDVVFNQILQTDEDFALKIYPNNKDTIFEIRRKDGKMTAFNLKELDIDEYLDEKFSEYNK